MINNLYMIKNRLSNRYNDVVMWPTDDYAIARIKDIAKVEGSPWKEGESELYRVAAVDIEKGEIKGHEPIYIDIPKGEFNIMAEAEKNLDNVKA